MRRAWNERPSTRATRWRAARLLAAALGLGLGLLGTGVGRAGATDAEARARARGWGHLIDKLVADGVPLARAVAPFADSRLPSFDGLGFSLAPSEPAARYRRLLSPASRAEARRCHARHAAAFAAAEAAHGVPASLIAAIIHVESACGRNTGSSPIFHRLARLAMASAPDNLAANVARHAGRGTARDPAVAERVRTRARYLEETFYPEVRAMFEIADRLGIDPLAMRGSTSGAFGFPQFLPTSYLRHGVDANGDGRVSLYDMEDAAASCANYLAHYGWRADLSTAEKRGVIWQYNRSNPYIDTILTLARHLGEEDDAPARVAREEGEDATP
jgi:membrane-bound lytic murein transglycosylase B